MGHACTFESASLLVRLLADSLRLLLCTISAFYEHLLVPFALLWFAFHRPSRLFLSRQSSSLIRAEYWWSILLLGRDSSTLTLTYIAYLIKISLRATTYDSSLELKISVIEDRFRQRRREVFGGGTPQNDRFGVRTRHKVCPGMWFTTHKLDECVGKCVSMGWYSVLFS